ncbi:GGDEF domain-containing protein [Spirulina sp. CS-785/01]|uniref:GGDEF domain-containing protein n=1 Tax=Spirulina sp. CS-785/01 TaxID=3021716 RepID=UPI00232FF761|nr:GGDEF domain-containing protein [Spirulina sp. CS-785/01]MDB9311597.1 GGDEF domain-containing protein [Spirulina sp. CS-785/01]
MNAEIGLIGGNDFIATVTQRCQLPIHRAIASYQKTEILSWVHNHETAILIIEASSLISQGLCQDIKASNPLRYLYCIVVAQPQHPLSLTEEAEMIEQSADAYLRFSSPTATPTEQILLENRLFSAYLQAGMRQVNQFYQLQHTNDILSTIALSDSLTGLGNRRALEWELSRQIQLSRHQQQPVSLIIIDVDYFKSVNDTHGHLIGDRILQLLTIRLQNSLRVQDTLFRYGGEEFIVLLRQSDLTQAEAIGQHLRRSICETPFTLNRGLTLSITISLGLTQLQDTDDPQGQNILQRADDNLFKAKNAGRNRLVSSI